VEKDKTVLKKAYIDTKGQYSPRLKSKYSIPMAVSVYFLESFGQDT
jgi:hypothetical protein